MSRAVRTRMTEVFVAARDAGLVVQFGSQKVFGGAGLPDYALGDRAPTMKTGEDLYRDFAHLVKPRTH